MTTVNCRIRLTLIIISATVGKISSGSGPEDACISGTFYNTSTRSCEDCSVGQYQPASAQTNCLNCPKGTEQSKIGQTSCISCSVGWMAREEGSEYCSECPPGTFANETKTEDCPECEPGTHSNTTGKERCNLCQPGYYQDESGMTDCKPCPVGEYNDQWGQIECLPCPTGTTTNNTGSTKCEGEDDDNETEEQCTAGNYSPTGTEPCKPCEMGTFLESGGGTSCKACPAGMATFSSGSEKCKECEKRMCVYQGRCFKCSNDTIKNCHDEDSRFHELESGFCHSCTHQCKDNSYLFSVAGLTITMEMVTVLGGCLLFLFSFCILLGCWRHKKRKNKVSSTRRKQRFEKKSSPSRSQLIITIRSQEVDHLPAIDLDF